MRKPQPIHSILEDTLKALEIDVPLKSYSIWSAWKEIVGETISLQTQPHAIRNRILFINVSHPTWMQQLQFLKPTLLEKINNFLGESLILDIRFKLGKIPHAISFPTKGKVLESEKLDQATLNRIERIVQRIEDQEVRESLRAVLIKGAKLERYRKE